MTDSTANASEPSMEDILASIRRIIDEEDTREEVPVVTAPRRPVVAPRPPAERTAKLFSISGDRDNRGTRDASSAEEDEDAIFPERESAHWSRATGGGDGESVEEHGADTDQPTGDGDIFERARNKLEAAQNEARQKVDELAGSAAEDDEGSDALDLVDRVIDAEESASSEDAIAAFVDKDEASYADDDFLSEDMTAVLEDDVVDLYERADDDNGNSSAGVAAAAAASAGSAAVFELTSTVRDDVEEAETATDAVDSDHVGMQEDPHEASAEDSIFTRASLDDLDGDSGTLFKDLADEEETAPSIETTDPRSLDELADDELLAVFQPQPESRSVAEPEDDSANNERESFDSGTETEDATHEKTKDFGAGMLGAAAGGLYAAKDVAADATGYVGDLAGDAAGTVSDGFEAVTDAAGDATGYVGDLAGDAAGTVSDGVEAMTDAAGDATGYVGDLAGDAAGTVSDGLDAATDAAGDAADKSYGGMAGVAAGAAAAAGAFFGRSSTKEEPAETYADPEDRAETSQERVEDATNDVEEYASDTVGEAQQFADSAFETPIDPSSDDVDSETVDSADFPDRFRAEDVYAEVPPSLEGDYRDSLNTEPEAVATAAGFAGAAFDDESDELDKVGGMVRDALEEDSVPKPTRDLPRDEPLGAQTAYREPADPSALVSMTSEEISARALASLADPEAEATRRVYGALKISDGPGSESIEGVVRDLLRPMLREWLDDNLPNMVEGMVRSEVERISAKARRYKSDPDS